MEEILSQMGSSLKMPFRYTQLSRSPSTHSLSIKHQWTHSVTPDDQMHYCVHVRVTLGEERGIPCPLPMHVMDY